MNENTNLSYQYMVYQETHGITGIVHQHIKEIMDKITCNTDESHVSHHPGLQTKSMEYKDNHMQYYYWYVTFLPLNSHEWLRENFSLQKTSVGNKEIYLSGPSSSKHQ